MSSKPFVESAYVRNQKEHHAKGTTHARLEAIQNDD
jgi:hypothetical protein